MVREKLRSAVRPLPSYKRKLLQPIQPAGTTPLPGFGRSDSTKPDSKIRPTVCKRSKATQPGSETRPMVLSRSITIPAQITWDWASMLDLTSPLAVAMCVSARASWGLLARATPPGSEMFTPRSHLAGQFTLIQTTRSARSPPHGASRRRSDRWRRPAKQSWR